MLQKLEQIAETLKTWILYVLGPIAFLAGIIWYLVSSKEDLEHRLNESQAQTKIEEEEKDEQKIDDQADNAVANYDALKQQYDRESNPDTKPKT